jgi:excisionase family DNA binding protein
VPIVHYITVQDAAELLGVVERTIRRWIKEEKVRVIRDPSNFVRLDLAEIEQIVQKKAVTTPFLHQQIEALLQRVEALESDKEVLVQKYVDLQRQVEALLHLLAQHQATDGNEQPFSLSDFLRIQVPLRRQAGNVQGRVEKRGLPPGTMRLVDFVKIHQVNLWELKQLHWAGTITLEVYQREGEAKRNKQEWWVTPTQHQQISAYWHQQGIAYTACPQCDQQQEGVSAQAG